MKRLNRKETRFIALILAVCMIIGILYINDREKVALADDNSAEYTGASLTSEVISSCISTENEVVSYSPKTTKYVVGKSSAASNSKVSVKVTKTAIGSLSADLQANYDAIKYYALSDTGEKGAEITGDVVLSSTNKKVGVYLKKKDNTEENLVYKYEWAESGIHNPTLSFGNSDDNKNNVVISGEESDYKRFTFEGNKVLDDAGSPSITNIYVGSLKYCIDKNDTISAQTSWKDFDTVASTIDSAKGDFAADGTYYLHKAYYVGETKVCDYTTTPGADRGSSPAKVSAASVTKIDGADTAEDNRGAFASDSQKLSFSGVNINNFLKVSFSVDVDVDNMGTEATADDVKRTFPEGAVTCSDAEGITSEFNADGDKLNVTATIPAATADNDGKTVSYTFSIASKKDSIDEPAGTFTVAVTYGNTLPQIDSIAVYGIDVVGEDESSTELSADNPSAEEKTYYSNNAYYNVAVAASMSSNDNNGAKVGTVLCGEEGLTKNEDTNKYSFSSKKLLSDETTTLSFKAKATSGKESGATTIKIIKDTTDPVIPSFKVTQGGIDYVIYKNETDPFANTITAVDPFSISFSITETNLKAVSIQRKIGEDGTPTTVTVPEPVGGVYTIAQDDLKGASYFDKVVTYSVTVTDKANNTLINTYKFKFINDNIDIRSTVEAINSVDSSKRGSLIENERTPYDKITIKYEVTTYDTKLSDLPVLLYGGVDSISLTYVDKSTDPAVTKPLTNIDDALTSSTAPYTYEFTATYIEPVSVKRNNLTATFKNENNYPNSDTITIIAVDLDDPKASLSGANETTWYPGLTIKVVAQDKTDSYYSSLKTATVTQSGSKSDDGTQSILSADPTEIPSFKVAQSKSVSGTTITINVEDKVGRKYSVSKTFHVDEDKPKKENFTVGGIAAENIGDKVYEGDPVVAFGIKDNLNIAAYKLTVESPVGTKTVEGTNSGFTDNVEYVPVSQKVSQIIGQAVANGTYTLTLTAKDSAGNALDTVTTKFIVDNTKPVNDVIITTAKPAKFEKYHSSYSNPESGVSYEYGQYYAGKVSVDLQVIDDNVDTNDIVVTDNGDRVNVSWSAATINGKAGYKASYSTSNEGSHTITIATTDRAGQKATAKAVTYNVDNTAPTITASLNGSAISGGSGVRYLNVNGNVVVTANDKYFDEDDFTRVVKRTTPDKAVNNDTSNISNGSTPYTTDADYEITYKVVDRAGRETTLGPIEFRVDKVAPKLEVTGAASGGTARTNVSASMIITEDFYWDMTSVTCKIYKKVDGQGERLFEDVKVNPTSARTAINRALAEDGEYRFEMEATDKCGNHTTYTYSFIVDANAPLIELSGVKNYDSTDKAVDLIVKVTENFYTTNKLSISGTRTDINGDVEKLNLTGYNVNAAKVTTIPQQFKEDGIYDINVRSVDKAGNEDNKKVHFTIDSKAPIIKSLPEYDGTLFSEFKWDEDPDDLVTDLTVCQVTILMDGVEYDGLTELSDGSHTLRIEAVDELGHESSAEYTFLVDTKPPTILVTGVENGEVILEERNIDISLQLDEDMLRSVTLNGKAISVANNTAKLTINEKGTYTLKVEAVDKAGNVSTIEYTFTFGKTANWWWLIILIAAILLLLIIFFIIYKNRWNQKN